MRRKWDHLSLLLLGNGGETQETMAVKMKEATEAARAHFALDHFAFGV